MADGSLRQGVCPSPSPFPAQAEHWHGGGPICPLTMLRTADGRALSTLMDGWMDGRRDKTERDQTRRFVCAAECGEG